MTVQIPYKRRQPSSLICFPPPASGHGIAYVRDLLRQRELLLHLDRAGLERTLFVGALDLLTEIDGSLQNGDELVELHLQFDVGAFFDVLTESSCCIDSAVLATRRDRSADLG